MLGAKHFAAHARWPAEVDGVIVCEPEGGEICAVAKGALRLRVELHRRDGPRRDAAPRPQPAARRPARVSSALRAGCSGGCRTQHGEHEHLGGRYLTPTVLRAGDRDRSTSSRPARRSASTSAPSPASTTRRWSTAVAAMARRPPTGSGVGVDVDVIDDRPAGGHARRRPGGGRARRGARARSPASRPVLGGVPGATDGTILTRDAGLPTVVYGPGGKWIAHQADEFVEVADIVRCARVYAEAARRFLTREHRSDRSCARDRPTALDRRRRPPGRARHPARRRLADRHDRGAAPDRRRRRRGGRARRRPGHPGDRPARPAQRWSSASTRSCSPAAARSAWPRPTA